MHSAKMSGDHTQRCAVTSDERGGLYRAEAGRVDNVKHGHERRIHFDIVNDNPLTLAQCPGAGASVVCPHLAKEVKEVLLKPVLSLDCQNAATLVQQLNVSKVRAK